MMLNISNHNTNVCIKLHFDALNFLKHNCVSVFWTQPFRARPGDGVTGAAPRNQLKKILSIFMPQTSINVFHIRSDQFFGGSERHDCGATFIPLAPPQPIFTRTNRRALPWGGGRLLSYCLCYINNKKIG